jgi:GTPase Era involved in 16S rRNA processing
LIFIKRIAKLEQLFLSACIVGAPNAGKSTLLNYIIGEEVSATSDKV